MTIRSLGGCRSRWILAAADRNHLSRVPRWRVRPLLRLPGSGMLASLKVGQSKRSQKPWNHALALISLVATPAAIAAAEKMGATFWNSTLRMEKRGAFDEASWSEIVQDLRSVRLDFINVARKRSSR